MKKLIFAILLLITGLNTDAQVIFKFGNVSGDSSTTVDVPVLVDGFTNVLSTQYSVIYDSLVLEIVDVVNRHPQYNVNFTDHRTGVRPKNGQLAFQWDEPNLTAITLPANSKLFDIRFKLIGRKCDSSLISLSSTPTPVEILNGNGDPINASGQNGKVKINGTNCPGGGGGNPSDVIFIASSETVPKGDSGCVTISVRNFRNIQSMQANLKWDKTVARFSSVRNINSGLGGLNYGGTMFLSQDSTELRWLWSHPQGQSTTLADNSTIFQVCYTAVGNDMSMTDINFISTQTNVIEVVDVNSNVLNTQLVKGKFTVIVPPSTITLITRDTTVIEGQEYCMPILVKDFTCIEAFQFAMRFDNTKLRYKRISGANLRIGPGDVEVSNDSIRVIWTAIDLMPVTLNDGTILFNICFDVIGNCVMTTKPTFINLGSSPIEFTAACGRPPMPAFLKVEGTITINCPSAGVDCDITGVTPAKCFGENSGSVNTTVTGGSGSYTYNWINDVTGLPVSPTPSPAANPTNLAAGRYRLVVRDNNAPFDSCVSANFTISQPDEIIINFSVTHESSVRNDGTIQANVTGGCQPYKYRWFRVPVNNPVDTINSRVTNLRCGNYALSLTDCNGCVARDTTRVNCFTEDPTCSITILDSIRCFGDCTGRIRVEVNGGTIPFRYNWSTDSTGISVSRLCAGSYTVTVTDALNRTTTCTINLTAPDSIKIVVDSIVGTNASSGRARTTTTGGTAPYTYVWTNSSQTIVSNSKDLLNVPAGTYTLVVTDKNNCTKSIQVVIPTEMGGGDSLQVSIAIRDAISCNGACDGSIIATVTGGSGTLIYRWSHQNNLNSNIASSLCPGTYRVTVTSSNGTTATAGPLTLTEAPDININIRRISCESDQSAADGSYEALVSGGVRPYTYSWCNGEIASTATALNAGECSVTVTDANLCTKVLRFTVCSEDVKADCFAGRLAISPNGDGANDNLVISCSENFANILQIFSRWGQLVYQEVDYANGWSGVDLDGNILPDGTYMWVLTVKEPGKNDVLYKSHVTIVR
ncbi:MAG: gliding motility-associated C-terminal domain-containing protein [Saprospiraceae bacterium]|nr:gliding motility-associated C-terminal domain-containing protein [Saprospiraceae bacterium]